MVSDTSPKQIGGLSGGLFNTFGNMAGITTPIVIGYIVQGTGSFNGALLFVGINAFIAMAAYLVMVGEIKRVELKGTPDRRAGGAACTPAVLRPRLAGRGALRCRAAGPASRAASSCPQTASENRPGQERPCSISTRSAGFVAVAEELHFGRAAERLNMTQPPLSRQVQILERILDVALFERNQPFRATYPRRPQLPARGTPSAEARRQCGLVAKRVAAGKAGSIRIGFTAASAYSFLPDLVAACRTQTAGCRSGAEGDGERRTA